MEGQHFANLGQHLPASKMVSCPRTHPAGVRWGRGGMPCNEEVLSPVSLPFLSSLYSDTPPGVSSGSGVLNRAKPAPDPSIPT